MKEKRKIVIKILRILNCILVSKTSRWGVQHRHNNLTKKVQRPLFTYLGFSNGEPSLNSHLAACIRNLAASKAGCKSDTYL